MDISDIKKKSLQIHLKNKGKLSIKSNIDIKNAEDLSVAYTPGVAEVCNVVAEDKKKALDYTVKGNSIAVVTDGSAVLGLGNIGPEAALPVMEGKAILFKEFAGVNAWPICLATQDTEEIIKAVKLIAPGFGGINLEDISAPRCFEIEKRLGRELDIPVFHDDQHGTAIIVLAGLINALKVVGKKLSEVKILLNGAGAAGTAISNLLISAGAKRLALLDSKGVIHCRREDLNTEKKIIAAKTNRQCCVFGLDHRECIKGDLKEAVRGVDVFIGVSRGGLLKKEMAREMNDRSIIFALANPEPEIMPDVAKEAGAIVVATGRSDFPNQLNNVLVFPGIFRGALDNRVKKITTEMKINAAKALANLVKNPTADKIIPGVFDEGIVEAVSSVIKN